MDKNVKTVILAVVGGLLLSTLIISKYGLTIRTQNSGLDQNGRAMNSITTDGTGKVYLKPDMALINFTFSESARNTSGALDAVNKKMNQAKDILKKQGIADKDIETTNLSIYPEYDYSQGRVPKIISQRATLTAQIKVKKIDDTASKPSQLIDQLSEIDGIQMGGLSFDVEDKDKFQEEARTKAVEEARTKANSLAKLTGVGVGKPVSISESAISAQDNYRNMPLYYSAKGDSAPSPETSLDSGQITLHMSVSVIWSIE